MIRTAVLMGTFCAMLAAPLPALAQAGPDPVTADLMRDWKAQQERMTALADAMPPEKYTFKATPLQRTFGEQLMHLSEAHVGMLKRLDAGGKVPVPELSKSAAKPDVIKSLTQAYEYGAVVLAQAGTMTEKLGETSRARTVWSAMGNAMNHYGQCVVYLRLNDIVPPASRPKSQN